MFDCLKEARAILALIKIEAVRSQFSKLAFLIFGEQGTWKSSLCLDFAKMKRPDGTPFRVLYIDAESGSIDDRLDLLEEEGFNLENIYIVYTQSLKEVQQYLKKIANKEPFYELDDDGNETEEIVTDADGNSFFLVRSNR